MEIISGEKNLLEKKVARLISRKISENNNDYFVLGLVGGKSVKGILDDLKREVKEWKKVNFFMVDERRVDLADKESNYRAIYDSFFKELLKDKKISKKNLHPYNHNSIINDYSNKFKKFGGKFDLVILSAAEDGHIAGLFPNFTIKKTNKEFFTFDNSPKPPSERMTASRYLIEQSNSAILLFFGDEKKETYKNFLNNKIPIDECPAKIVKNISDSYVFTNIEGY